MSTKELKELVKAVSAVLLEAVESMRDDNKLSMWEGIKALHLIPTILSGIKGVSEVPMEARDIQQDEWDEIVKEVRDTMLKAGASYRNSDIVERVMQLAYTNVCELSEIVKLPPTAEKVE